VKITLSSSGLTKIVTFTPFFVVVNEAKVFAASVLFSGTWRDYGDDDDDKTLPAFKKQLKLHLLYNSEH